MLNPISVPFAALPPKYRSEMTPEMRADMLVGLKEQLHEVFGTAPVKAWDGYVLDTTPPNGFPPPGFSTDADPLALLLDDLNKTAL